MYGSRHHELWGSTCCSESLCMEYLVSLVSSSMEHSVSTNCTSPPFSGIRALTRKASSPADEREIR